MVIFLTLCRQHPRGDWRSDKTRVFVVGVQSYYVASCFNVQLKAFKIGDNQVNCWVEQFIVTCYLKDQAFII